jgi:hypothetical protein
MLSPNTPPYTPMARARSPGSVKVLVMIDIATGLSIDPPTATQRIRSCASRKTARLTRSGFRRPMTRWRLTLDQNIHHGPFG